MQALLPILLQVTRTEIKAEMIVEVEETAEIVEIAETESHLTNNLLKRNQIKRRMITFGHPSFYKGTWSTEW